MTAMRCLGLCVLVPGRVRAWHTHTCTYTALALSSSGLQTRNNSLINTNLIACETFVVYDLESVFFSINV